MKTYTIFKGCHYSTFFPKFRRCTDTIEQTANVVFTDSCRYEIDESSCVNKLFGFCFGFGVHKDSIRIGWTYNKAVDNIYIWYYAYVDGKLTKEKIASAEIGQVKKLSIKVYKNGPKSKILGFKKAYDVTVLINDSYELVDQAFSSKSFYTTLGPYFGGNSRAPHKIKIQMDYETTKG